MTKLSAFLLFVALFFAGAESSAAQTHCTRHVEAQARFSICIPEGWTAREREGNPFKMLFGEPVEGFAPNLNFREEMSSLKLNDYVAAGIKTVLDSKEKIGATSIEVQSQTDFATAAGGRGVRVVFLSQYKGHWVRSIQYLFDAGPGRKLILTGTSLDKNKEVFDRIFDRAANSFRIG